MVDALEHRDVATSDVPGAFLHSDLDEDVTVIVDGALVDLLLKSNNKYAKYVHICKNGKKVVFLKLDKALLLISTKMRQCELTNVINFMRIICIEF
jgi:hypothetical protein